MNDSTKTSAFTNPRRSGPAGPLTGVRVLDLSAYIAGPYGCTLLADQGADVIKIEPPDGDNLRQYPSTLQSENRAFLGVNRSKRGMVLDLKNPAELRVLTALVREADVLVHNFRPGVAERLAIDHPRLSVVNPRLIYCAVTGYGEQGPLRDKAGYDQVLQAMSGMCVLQGGQFVGVSLLRSALTMQSARMIWAEGEALDIWRDMRSGGITGLHPTRSGYLYLSANTPRFWKALCAKTELTELAGDVRYDTVRKRAEHAAEIVPKLRAVLLTRTALEWEVLLGDQVPCAVARRIEDMFDHPQVLAENMVASIVHPTLGSYRGVSRPIKFGRTPGPEPFAAPTLGQDSEAVTAVAGRKPES
jgi:crotonobetainyl-CoA:carnitine CoA-transferase CaiB-like acyl-CoA transferase